MRRTFLLALALASIAAACGDNGLFDGLGDRTSDAVAGTTTTTLAPNPDTEPDGAGHLIPSTTVTWFNDHIEGEAVGLPAFTIAQVWERGHSSSRFVQSSRAEIAVALPGIAFPSSIPSEVVWVTSQLVYLEDIATLDSGLSAAFGLWEVEPYSSDDGRVSVLRVGADRGDRDPFEVSSEVVTSGRSLIWSDGTYRYELFCRASLPEEMCQSMVDSAAPLRDLLGSEL